ncbi:hypothetical protein C8R46DRAFT_1223976 [Mycena filopes]|nr:hypothetical protein C8R46DRAFT_1223976 [Mycena filopes]
MPEDSDEVFGLLPVCYANLDPGLIPPLDILDDDNDFAPSTHFSSIQNAEKCLNILTVAVRPRNFPLDAASDLWPRIWKWIDFLRLYRACGPPLTTSRLTRIQVHLINSQLILKCSAHSPSAEVMWATRGVRHVLAAAWETLVHQWYDANDPETLRVIALPLLALSHILELEDLEEVVDACDGSFTSLALTLKKNILQIVAHSEGERASSSITPVLLFLNETIQISDEYVACLLSCGIVAPLVAALGIGQDPPRFVGVPDQPLDVGFGIGPLIELLNAHPGYPWTVEALKAGLMRRVVTSGMRFATEVDAGRYVELLTTVLPRALVSYTVVAEMRNTFSAVGPLSQSAAFSRSALYGHWQRLEALTNERGKVLDAWEASGRATNLACYNMSCDKIDGRDSFKRCSTCRTASYCSRECQQLDWTVGHRDECHRLLAATLTYEKIGLRYHEKSFLRTLVHSDYQRLRLAISYRMMAFMVECPGTQFFVAFDFTGAGGVECSVHPISELGVGENIPQWARLARAGGRLTLHVVRLGHGVSWSNVAFPLRATSSQFYDELVEIAKSIEGNYSRGMPLVRDLIARIDSDTSYREIH